MSTSRVSESRVLDASVDRVWDLVRPVTFAFWSAVQKVDVEGGPVDAVGSVRVVYFKDGSVQKFRILELSDLEHYVTYEVFESSVPTLVLAAFHTIRLRKVTHDNTTFVDFSSEFASGPNTAAVIEDSKYKKIEALASCHYLAPLACPREDPGGLGDHWNTYSETGLPQAVTFKYITGNSSSIENIEDSRLQHNCFRLPDLNVHPYQFLPLRFES
ncbi:hypothetical protein HDU83_006348 [Entophlyctis luteolus]|nr:hypothetical protein HDU83_006348 [Entophlyctis luteolus]KAJ3392741.1 hypothetical protein HDU84_003478 [Entophlyctis sp. JEL0112]